MRRFSFLLLVLASAAAVGCSRPPTSEQAPPLVPSTTWELVSESSLTPDQQDQLTRGRQAQQTLAQTLMAELVEAIDNGDPAATIEVCRSAAPRITREVSTATGVRLGRTSHRLRNPVNTPPEWARTVLAVAPETPQLLRGPSGELAALTPIRLKPACEICHGPREAIDDAVIARLAELYPEDQATGFVAGDLRGWFWFEVPAS